jgi:hypothetical protein
VFRVLIAVLLLAGCATSSPPSPPTGVASPPPAPATQTTPPQEPPPADWFTVVLVSSFGGEFQGSGNPPVFNYRDATPTMHLTFRNKGAEPITSPTVELELEQRSENMTHGNQLLTYFTGEASGEGWDCTGSEATVTCTSATEIAPGEALPTIEAGLKALDSNMGVTHFTAALGEHRYEATMYYDTST